MTTGEPRRKTDIRRWELRLLVAIPTVFVLLAVTEGFLAIELTVRALGVDFSPVERLALGKVRLLIVGLGSMIALGFGLALALTITHPLRRLVETVRRRLPPGHAPAKTPTNELTELSNTFNHMLLSFDKFVTDSHILDGMPVGVLVVDAQNRVKQTNAEARRLVQVIGQPPEGGVLSELPLFNAGSAVSEALATVRATGSTVEVPSSASEARLVTLTPVTASGEIVVTIRDLSQVSKIRGEIQRVDKLAALGAHVASLAHEVSGSLMAVQTLAGLLPPKSNEDGAILAKLEGELERAGRLLDEIRAFGQATIRDRVPCDLSRLVEETLWVVEPRFIEKRLQVVKRLAPDLPPILGDGDRLTQAVLNVFTNAFEATPAGGAIRVVTERDEGVILLRVANSGSYIPPEERQKIFNLFYTTKKRGTGFGLPLARRAVMDHGGDIAVSSTEETGTEFVLSFPASHPRN